jgi:hypothetical protein
LPLVGARENNSKIVSPLGVGTFSIDGATSKSKCVDSLA